MLEEVSKREVHEDMNTAHTIGIGLLNRLLILIETSKKNRLLKNMLVMAQRLINAPLSDALQKLSVDMDISTREEDMNDTYFGR